MKNKIKPIKPSEVVEEKQANLPDEVIDCFNKLIAKNMSGNSSIIKQCDIVSAICKAMNIDSYVVYKEQYLDVEDIYRKQGWKVIYDKPAYCETYEPTFTFSKK